MRKGNINTQDSQREQGREKKSHCYFEGTDAIKFILTSPHDTISISQRKARKQKERPSYRLTGRYT